MFRLPLVGNLGQELGALDERFRVVLLATLSGWQTRIQACQDDAKRQGQIRQETDTGGLARFFWYAWEGAVLGAKLEKSRAPLDEVSRTFIGHLRSLAPEDVVK